MAQLTIYLPEPALKKARREAKRRGQSLSAYVARLVEGDGQGEGAWPEDFLATFGGWGGKAPKLEELRAERRESFD